MPFVIEYVCSRNVTRSPSYEAVTNHIVREKGLNIKVVSSGLNVDRLNTGNFAEHEIKSYLQMALDLEPYLKDHETFVKNVKSLFSQNMFTGQEPLRLALQAMWYIDVICIRMCERALRSRGIEYDGTVQVQTRPRNDVNLLIPLQRSYVGYLEELYNDFEHRPRIISVEEIGPKPLPYGFELKDFEAVVDTALENVPEILNKFVTGVYM